MTRGRPYIIVLLVCSLSLAGVSRWWAARWREQAAIDPLLPSTVEQESQSSLSGMDSYALALLLGGLRGPLVMFLWSTSETQKSAHDLEDFDTKVEWIRLLQPEFDTVHLFQIWNKAYNVSVQMANLPNKYSAIVDGLGYANSIDRERPDDINIIDAMGNIFSDKLAGIELPAAERAYYLRRVCQDTQAPRTLTRVTVPQAKLDALLGAARAAGMDEPTESIDADDTAHTVTVILRTSVADAVGKMLAESANPRGWADVKFSPLPPPRPMTDLTVRPTRLSPMLDEEGNVLLSLVAAKYPRPTHLSAAEAWYDGSRLQFLKKYEPFPEGLTPSALGFNYAKRAQLLQLVAHETHLQRSEYVIDSHPSVAQKYWGAEQGELGRRSELRLFGLDDHGDRLSIEQHAPGTDPARAIDAAMFARQPDPMAGTRALYEYGFASRLYRDSRSEYLDVLGRYPDHRDVLLSHINDTLAFEQLYQADHDFLQGLLTPEQRQAMWGAAADHYRQAEAQFDLIIFRYYVSDALARQDFPNDPTTGEPYRRQTIDQMPVDRRDLVLVKILTDLPAYAKKHSDDSNDDRTEYLTYVGRCQARMNLLRGGPSAGK